MVIFSKLPSAAQYDLENQFSRDNNMNNNKKDAKTAYRPYDYAIGKILTQILADGQVTYALTFGHTGQSH